jgi:hypothetical protein
MVIFVLLHERDVTGLKKFVTEITESAEVEKAFLRELPAAPADAGGASMWSP